MPDGQEQEVKKAFLDQKTTVVDYIKRVMSDDGEPSSSRWLEYIIAVFACAVLGCVFWHMIHLKDSTALGQWLQAVPYIVAAFTGMFIAPYGVRASASTLSDLSMIFKKRD